MYFVTNGFPFACYNVRSYFVTKWGLLAHFTQIYRLVLI